MSDAEIERLSNELRDAKELMENLHSENAELIRLNEDFIALTAEYGIR